jgi:hypothetical protein
MVKDPGRARKQQDNFSEHGNKRTPEAFTTQLF